MPRITTTERARELGSAGGRASAIARRKRRERDVGIVAWDVLHANPEPIVKRVYESGNAIAIVDLIRFATTAKDRQLKTRSRELDERERELRERERDVSHQEAAMEDWPTWVADTNAEAARMQAEVAELERQRDALRLEIEREANAHDMEWVQD
jgi:septal ring factor EnvC (AmiA/AmiB activator)